MAEKKSSKKRPVSGQKQEDVFEVKGKELWTKIKELIREGNTKEIIIKDKKGKTLVVMPLTWGVISAIIVPPLALIGTIAALITECTLTVKKR